MKNFIITLLSTLALSLSTAVFAGGNVVEAPTDANPAAQVAPLPAAEEEVADAAPECDAEKADCEKEETAATECDAEKADCEKEETAAVPETTDSPVQVAPAAEETTAS